MGTLVIVLTNCFSARIRVRGWTLKDIQWGGYQHPTLDLALLLRGILPKSESCVIIIAVIAQQAKGRVSLKLLRSVNMRCISQITVVWQFICSSNLTFRVIGLCNKCLYIQHLTHDLLNFYKVIVCGDHSGKFHNGLI